MVVQADLCRSSSLLAQVATLALKIYHVRLQGTEGGLCCRYSGLQALQLCCCCCDLRGRLCLLLAGVRSTKTLDAGSSGMPLVTAACGGGFTGAFCACSLRAAAVMWSSQAWPVSGSAFEGAITADSASEPCC